MQVHAPLARPARPLLPPPPGDGQPHAEPPLLRIHRRDDEACEGVCETPRNACGHPHHGPSVGGLCASNL